MYKILDSRFGACLAAVRQKTPLIHAITNYVTVNDCANILLAAGASPAMCEAADEAFEFSRLADALYLNIGTFTKEQEMAMYQAIRGAAVKGIPVVIDPVVCAALPGRIAFLRKLRYFGEIAVIKGNLGEIKALAGMEARARGVDSLDEGGENAEEKAEVCRKLAFEFSCVAAATGKEDIISDGHKTLLIQNHTELFTGITGAGCMAGALAAGYCGANTDIFLATAAALTAMSVAGELAVEAPNGKLPGSFRVNLIDRISLLNEEILLQRGRVLWL